MINRCSSTLGESESRKLGKALAGYVTKKKKEKKRSSSRFLQVIRRFQTDVSSILLVFETVCIGIRDPVSGE